MVRAYHFVVLEFNKQVDESVSEKLLVDKELRKHIERLEANIPFSRAGPLLLFFVFIGITIRDREKGPIWCISEGSCAKHS